MTQVETVRGPVATQRLGRVLMHEHVFVLSPEIQQNYPQGWDEEAEVEAAVTRLQALRESGIDTIVDLTVLGLGRFVPRVRRVNERVDLNIIVATGLYTFHDLPFYFHYRGPGTVLGGPEPMVEMFLRDIREGIADTGVRAGILKCATDEPGLTPGVERVLRAIAEVHRETGVPITTHTHASTRRGLDQQRIFREEGVDLSRVVIGHSGDTTDLGYLEELLAAGSWLGMDRFGLDTILSFEDRIATVAALCERGHDNRIVLSHDAACHNDFLPWDLVPALLPRWNYLHMMRDVVPALRARGVTAEQVDRMLIDNPRRFFEGVAT